MNSACLNRMNPEAQALAVECTASTNHRPAFQRIVTKTKVSRKTRCQQGIENAVVKLH